MVILRLEGRVVDAWVDEVTRACQEVLAEGRHLTLDMAEVSFIDRRGIAAFRALMSRQVGVVNCTPFVSNQLNL